MERITSTGKEEPFFQLVNLNKSYVEGALPRPVLKNVNITFARGEFTAILGKSGSGKTTLLNLVSGIDYPDSGEILLQGQNLAAMNDRQSTLFRRANIGFIFQFFNLIPTLTVWENVTLPLELNGFFDAHHRAAAEALLTEVELLDRAGAYPDRLSGGEQQRVSIVRALVHNPRLLLADEPTGNLDEETGEHVLALLDRLTRKAGKNLLLVTHSPEAAAYADRVLTLHEGQLLEKTHS